ncbi:MAG TPA: hypothetical protein VF388_04065 [Lacunisphaera sp.]
MTTPESDGQDLDKIIAQMEEHLAQLRARRDAERAETEHAQANAEAARRRQAFRVIPGVAAAAALGNRFLAHPAGSAVTASVLTAAAVTGGLILTHPGYSSHPPEMAQPPASGPPAPGLVPPPPVGSSPPASPTKPIPDVTGPRPQPPGGQSSEAPPSSSGESPTAPPTEPPSTSPAPEPSPPGRFCRVKFPRLPILRRGILCDWV